MIPFDTAIFEPIQGAYLVGGSVRDRLLGAQPADDDIAVLKNPQAFAKQLAARIDGHLVKIGKPGQMIFRVVSDNHMFDIALVNGSCIEDDLRQRDFTINALAYDLSAKKIINVTGGLQDLDRKKIRMVSKHVFNKDPIRLIRAFRLAADLDFDIEPQTTFAITHNASWINTTAGERIRAEMFKILRIGRSHKYLSEMADSGLLTAIFPELERLKGCMQNKNHPFDVFEHSIRAYDHLEAMLSNPDRFTDKMPGRIITEFDPEKSMLLKHAILLHDIGKPAQKKIDRQGIACFHGHARKGADLALNISKRLKLSVREMKFVDFIIRNHIRPLSLYLADQNRTLTPKGITRFFIKCGSNTPYLLLHSMADALAKLNQDTAKNERFITFIQGLMGLFFSDFEPKSKTPSLLTGKDLIDEFGLSPSPLFKTILKQVEEARLADLIHNKPGALKLVRRILSADS